MDFTRENCKTLTAEVVAELKALCEKHGLELVQRGGKFDAKIFDLKLQFRAKNESGETVTPGAADWPVYCMMFGFKADDLGRTVLVKGRKFRITGLNMRARSQPILVQEISTGKGFKMSPETAKAGLQNAVLYA